MKTEKDRLYRLLSDIRKLLEQSELPDGTFAFDFVSVMAALDFTKTTILKKVLPKKGKKD